MKVELSARTTWFIIVSLVVVGFTSHAGMVSGDYNPFIFLILISVIGLILCNFVPDDVLRNGNMVEWTDTEGVVRQGKIVGQHGENWLVHWDDYAVGVVDPKELRKVGK